MPNSRPAPPEASRSVQRADPQPAAEPHRANHGGSAWSLPSRRSIDLQPQDGSLTNPPRVAEMPARTNGGKLAGESEDSRMTGGTRSLSRRVLGLNDVAAERRKTPQGRTTLPTQVA
jgi:hypothetical protein